MQSCMNNCVKGTRVETRKVKEGGKAGGRGRERLTLCNRTSSPGTGWNCGTNRIESLGLVFFSRVENHNHYRLHSRTYHTCRRRHHDRAKGKRKTEMEMGEEQMDLIVGVDFGMTCTGKTSPDIWPVNPPQHTHPRLSARQSHSYLALGRDRSASTNPTLLAGLPQQLIPIPFLRSILRKFINWLQYCQMDPELARKGSRKREQGTDNRCLPKKDNSTPDRPDHTVLVGLPLRDCSRAEHRP